MSIANVVSISGGKDSTAQALLAVEQEVDNLTFAFADTGHEHPQTYEYLDYLDSVLLERCGVGITRVRQNFDEVIARKRVTVKTKWRKDGVSIRQMARALRVLYPTGIPFLDLCISKGRFPSTAARFCSSELKHRPIQEQIMDPLVANNKAVISWQGVRADESRARANLPMYDIDFGSWEPEPSGMLIYRPLINWTAAEVFAMHRRHGVKWNPLYEQGMGRVGCMPCIHANKSELRAIAKRFPEEFGRVAEWEELVKDASKRGIGSFFASDKTPGDHQGSSEVSAPGMMEVAEWALTARGGKQFDLIATSENPEVCASVYGLCE